MVLGSEIPALQVKSQFLLVERDSRQSPVDKRHPRARAGMMVGCHTASLGKRKTQKAVRLFGTTCSCSRWVADPPGQSHVTLNHNGVRRMNSEYRSGELRSKAGSGNGWDWPAAGTGYTQKGISPG